MFHITPNMLGILISLEKREDWQIFLKEFKQVRDEHVDESLHFVPNMEDFNARQRADILRGIALCLDVLYHAFEDPLKLLEEIRIIGKETEMKKDQNPF